MNLYHGTSNVFDKFDEKYARLKNDFYGGGLAYLTDSYEIAKSYSKASKKYDKSDKIPRILTVKTSFKKTFDIDKEYVDDDFLKLISSIDIDKFSRGAGLMSLGSDTSAVKYNVKKGNVNLKGDQIYKGLEKAFNNQTYKVRKHLEKCGFDSLRYNGGLQIKTEHEHDVYIAYRASTLKIIKVEELIEESLISEAFKILNS